MANEIAVRLDNPQSVEKFQKIFSAVHRVDADAAKQMYEVEKFSFLKEINDRALNDVTDVSVLGVFLDVISNGLSFGTMMKHVYLMQRSIKNAAGGWEKRLTYSTSPDGKIFMAQRSGEIQRVSKPVIVYQGDLFAVKTNDKGEEIITYEKKVPRESHTIIAAFVHTIYSDGRREPYWMELEDWKRLEGYSLRENSRKVRNGEQPKPNALYLSNNGQIDTGFLGAKLISFALKNVRKAGKPGAYEVQGDAADAAAATDGKVLPEVAEGAQYGATAIVTPVGNDAVNGIENAGYANDVQTNEQNNFDNDVNAPF